jgi:hypothetical protein
MRRILGTKAGWLGGTKVSIEDNKFQDFHTCCLAFKIGSLTRFVILMVCKTNFERKINNLRTNRKKEEESPISHWIMYQFLTAEHASSI